MVAWACIYIQWLSWCPAVWSALCGRHNWLGCSPEGPPPLHCLACSYSWPSSLCWVAFRVYFPSLIMGIGWCFCCGISMAFMVLMLGNVSVAPCSLCGGWSVGELAGRGWTHLGSYPISLGFFDFAGISGCGSGVSRTQHVENGYKLW